MSLLAAVIIGLLLGRFLTEHRSEPEHSLAAVDAQAAAPLNVPATPASTMPVPVNPISGVVATVDGTNVNLRAGPGLDFPVLARLLPGAGLRINSERGGWFDVTLGPGIGGWVFGAFLRGAGSHEQGAGVIQRGYTINTAPVLVFHAGDRVFFVRQPDGSAVVVLPSGQRLQVPGDALVAVD